MRGFVVNVVVLVATLGVVMSSRAGDLNPPAGPILPTMKTLDEVEPRIPVGPETTPGDADSVYRITARGSYYLTEDVVGVSGRSGILITATNVTLDLMGFSVRGVSGSEHGIEIPNFVTNIVIRNGNVTNWGQSGISGNIDSGRIEKINASSNGVIGIINSSGAFGAQIVDCDASFNTGGGILTSEFCRVVGCRVRANTGFGINLGPRSVVESCVVQTNAGDGIVVSSGCIVRGCATRATGGFTAMKVTGSENTIEDNIIQISSIGLAVQSTKNHVRRNNVAGNTTNYSLVPGNRYELILSDLPQVIDWPCEVTLAGNQSRTGTGAGITINSDDVTIDLGGYALIGTGVSNVNNDGITVSGTERKNLVIRNGEVRGWGSEGLNLTNARGARLERISVTDCLNVGILSGPAATVTDCKVISNLSTGFSLSVGSTAERCIAESNDAQGFVLGSQVHIRDCIARNNGVAGSFQGIVASGSSSNGVIDGCFVVGNDVGIQIFGAGWTVVRNIAKGNTTNFSIAAGNHAGDVVTTPGTADAYDNIANP